jgi:hypothetical protein
MPEELSLFDRALIFVFQVLGVSGLVYTAAVVFLGLIFGMVYDARAAYGHDGDPRTTNGT